MRIHIDTTRVPVAVNLQKADDFTALSVSVTVGTHTWISPSDLGELAGVHSDADLRQQFEGMVAFATSKGWTDAAGRIRAHVEVLRPPDG